jgi:hypothetical protein
LLVFKENRKIANSMLRKNSDALQADKDALIGKTLVGTAGIISAAMLANREEGKIRAELKDFGSFQKYVLSIPVEEGDDTFDEYLAEFYKLNKEAVDAEVRRDPSLGTPMEYLKGVLKDTDGTYEIELDRLSPFGVIFDVGIMINDMFMNIDPYDYDEDNTPMLDVVESMTEFLLGQGIQENLGDITMAFENPTILADRYLIGRLGTVLSPWNGVYNSPGDPLSRSYTPDRHNDSWRKMWEKTGVKRFGDLFGASSKAMKRRDFLGRAIVRGDRFANSLDTDVVADIIAEEMWELDIFKRAPKVDAVPTFPGIDLRGFELDASKATKEQKQLIEAVLGDGGVNAYEDYRIMVGQSNMGNVRGSTTRTLEQYFNSSEYKTIKGKIDELEKDYADLSMEEQAAASQALKSLRQIPRTFVSNVYKGGLDLAARDLLLIADLYTNKDGKTLQEAKLSQESTQVEGFKQAEETLRGLDALRGEE